MHKVPFSESVRIITRGSMNWVAERPIVVSFEVTDSCTCWCKHCDHGGPKDDSRNLKPADYRRYMDALRPCVVQVSGGEPLMRPDLVEIVRNIKSARASLHDPGLQLVDDDRGALPRTARGRHRPVLRQPGFPRSSATTISAGCPASIEHLSDIIPRLAALGHDDIVLNNCITSENLPKSTPSPTRRANGA